MTPGRGFLVNCPSVTCYWLPEGKTWEFLVFVGDMGRWHVDQLLTTTIERAVRFIEQEYGLAALSVDDLATRAGLSKFHFSRLFRERIGVSPFAYVTQVRMDKAMDLVISTQMPMKQIGQLVGFSDYSYFCRIFRQHCGTTPGRVRQSR